MITLICCECKLGKIAAPPRRYPIDSGSAQRYIKTLVQLQAAKPIEFGCCHCWLDSKLNLLMPIVGVLTRFVRRHCHPRPTDTLNLAHH